MNSKTSTNNNNASASKIKNDKVRRALQLDTANNLANSVSNQFP